MILRPRESFPQSGLALYNLNLIILMQKGCQFPGSLNFREFYEQFRGERPKINFKSVFEKLCEMLGKLTWFSLLLQSTLVQSLSTNRINNITIRLELG